MQLSKGRNQITALGLSIVNVDAQYVRRKPGFSVNISFNAPGPQPYREAIRIGPEWTWRNSYYVEVPGRWVRTPRRGSAWISGRWIYTYHRGYRWRRGHWR